MKELEWKEPAVVEGVSGLLFLPQGLLSSSFHILLGIESLLKGRQTRGSNYFIKSGK